MNPRTLAVCYWELSDHLPRGSKLSRLDCLTAARREYARAMAAAKDAREKSYLQLCLGAVDRATTQPATQPSLDSP